MVKQIAKTAWILGLTMALTSAVLVFVEASVKGRIEINGNAAVTQSIQTLVPNAAKTVNKGTYYVLEGADGKILGYAFVCAGRGYQSELKMMAAVDARFEKIIGIEVLEASETPGLGTHLADASFKAQFAGKDAKGDIAYVKGTPKKPNEISAISGATVSTRAFVNIVNAELAKKKAEIMR